MSTFTAAKTGFMRVFLAEGPARPDVALEYKLNAIMGAPSKSFGGTEDINIPDPNRYSAFLAVGETSEPDDPWELSLSARVPADSRNTLLQLAENRIRISAHVNGGGSGYSPQNKDSYQIKYVAENCRITEASMDELGSFDSDEPINAEISLQSSFFYQVLPLGFAEMASTLTTDPMTAAVVYDKPDETRPLKEQKVLFAGYDGDGASDKPDVLFSFDLGSTWTAFEVATLAASDAIVKMFILNDNLCVLHAGGLEYAPIDDFIAGTATFSSVTDAQSFQNAYSTGFRAYAVGETGDLFIFTDLSASTKVETGVAGTLAAVHALGNTVAVVGASNGMAVSQDQGATWTSVTGPSAGNGLTAVCVLGEAYMWVGDDQGDVFYTTNGGGSWTEVASAGGTGQIADIQFPTATVGYVAINSGTAGTLKRTVSGGQSWVTQSIGGTPDDIIEIACTMDPNFVLLPSTNSDGSTGYLQRGYA